MLLSNFTEKRVEAQGEERSFSTHIMSGRTEIQTHVWCETLASLQLHCFCVSCETAERVDAGRLFILGIAGIWRVKARKAETAQLMAWGSSRSEFQAEAVQDPGELPRSKED